MPDRSTLIVTTRTGVRPLGVRGEPLHNAAGQLRRVVRRRLGDAAARLLADPQLHEDGKAIDWYADGDGAVRCVADLEPGQRAAVLGDVDRSLAAIAGLGDDLARAASVEEDTGVIGRSLQLAARRPAESFVYLLGEQPVVVCWGYEKEAANALMAPGLPSAPRPSAHQPVLSPPPATVAEAAPAFLPVALPARLAAAPVPWLHTLLAALPLLALLLGSAWLLRDLLPTEPALALATREGPPAPPPPPAPPDPLPVLKASLQQEASRSQALRIEMDAIQSELKKRIADCKPVELPKEPPKEPVKPPQVASIAPPTPKPAPQPPPQPPRYPGDDRLRLPQGPTSDYSFMQGCWRSDPFRHEMVQDRAGVSSYCFNSSGYGQLEWRKGRTACRTRAQARFDGSTLALRDSDTTCNDGSHWYADQLVCQRGAGDVAQCSGTSRGALGPTTWVVNLHKLD